MGLFGKNQQEALEAEMKQRVMGLRYGGKTGPPMCVRFVR
jgi:hypothetical protein